MTPSGYYPSGYCSIGSEVSTAMFFKGGITDGDHAGSYLPPALRK